MKVFSANNASAYEAKQAAVDRRHDNPGRPVQQFDRDKVDEIKAEGADVYANRMLKEYRDKILDLRRGLLARGIASEVITPAALAEVKEAWHL